MTALAEPITARVSKGSLWAGWILGLLPVALLLFSASGKVLHAGAVVEGFHKFGYADRVILPLGIVEVACAVLYLIPRTAVLGAVLLTGYLGGAVATHFRIGDPAFVMPALCGVVLWLGLFLRDRRLRVLLPLRQP